MLTHNEWVGVFCVLRGEEQRRIGRGHPPTYPAHLMAFLALWAAAHRLPITDLAQQLREDGWPAPLKHALSGRMRRRRPDASTLSRRFRQAALLELLRRALLRFAAEDSTYIIDAFVLPVGPHSRDVEARFGGPGSQFMRGYKAVRVTNRHGQAVAVHVISADRNEVGAAPTVVDYLAAHIGCMKRLLGDAIFDAEALREQVALQLDAMLIAPSYARRQGWNGRVAKPRRGAHRRRCQRLLKTPWGQYWLKVRKNIERSHGWLRQRPHELGFLPSFIRGSQRVTRWMLCHDLLLSYRKALRMRSEAA